nr:hypothetical protein [Mucilaginibacter sp. X4EP1]
MQIIARNVKQTPLRHLSELGFIRFEGLLDFVAPVGVVRRLYTS